jgi:hypothetical protein
MVYSKNFGGAVFLFGNGCVRPLGCNFFGTQLTVLARQIARVLRRSEETMATQVARPADTTQSAGHSRLYYLLVGGICGLAWSVGLRGFMTQVAGAATEFLWVGTYLWIVLPGVIIGTLLGLAEYRRHAGLTRGRRWLIWSPLLFAAVLLSDPLHFGEIFDDGVGGGAIGVPLFAIAGGYAIGGRGRRWSRILCGVLVATAIPIWALTAARINPDLALNTPRGAWCALFYWSFLGVFMLACAIPQQIGANPETAHHSPGIYLVAGGVCGLAWASGFRVWMVQAAGSASNVTWATIIWLLVPGAIIGTLLGLAEYRHQTGITRGRRWLIWSPLIFISAIIPQWELLISNGFGGGAIIVALLGIGGGYAIAGRGRPWVRIAARIVVGLVVVSVTLIGGTMGPDMSPALALSTPLGAWVATLFLSFIVVLMIACAIPQRIGRPQP